LASLIHSHLVIFYQLRGCMKHNVWLMKILILAVLLGSSPAFAVYEFPNEALKPSPSLHLEKWAYTKAKELCTNESGLTDIYSQSTLTAFQSAIKAWSFNLKPTQNYFENRGFSFVASTLLKSDGLITALNECYGSDQDAKDRFVMMLISVDEVGTLLGSFGGHYLGARLILRWIPKVVGIGLVQLPKILPILKVFKNRKFASAAIAGSIILPAIWSAKQENTERGEEVDIENSLKDARFKNIQEMYQIFNDERQIYKQGLDPKQKAEVQAMARMLASSISRFEKEQNLNSIDLKTLSTMKTEAIQAFNGDI